MELIRVNEIWSYDQSFAERDRIELYRLVMQKYWNKRLKDGLTECLWSDSGICLIHTLLKMLFGAFHINQKMKYPLSKEACQVMLKMKLLDGKMNEVCYKLLKMIEKQAGIRKTTTTPIESNKPLVKDEDGIDVDVHVHVYRSMIGSLMYLTASRPDIMFAVCACARFQVTLKASHLNAVKRIFRYLKHQPKLGLWYPRDSPFELEAYSDSDYGGASLDRKSTTGGCQFLRRRLISWQCKKLTIVANSTTEAEYVAAANCCGQVLWIPNQMMGYGFNFMNTKIHIDNEITLSVIKNPVAHSRTKHIEIRFHFIRDCYEKRLIEVIKIHTDHNVADLLTKGFDVTRISMDLRMDRCSAGKFYSYMVFNSGSLQVNSGGLLVNSVDLKLILGKNFLGKVTLLFDSMLVQQIEDEGDTSERPSDSPLIPSLPHPKGSGGNHGGYSSNDASLSGNEDGLTLQSVYDLCVSLCKQVTAQAKEIKALKAQFKKLKKGVKPLITHHKAWMKTRLARKTSLKKKGGEPSVHKDPTFDDLDDFVHVHDTLDYMKSEDAQDEGRTNSVVLEEKESANEGVSTEAPVSINKQYEGTNKKNDGTDKQDRGTDNTKVSTDRQGEGTADQNEGKSVTQTHPTSTSTRSILTLRPLPKIDPKDKGKKRIEEEDESDTESEGITEAENKFKQLTNDEEVARKARLNADKILAEKL
ncbi:hypothetical protein Tco_0110872 [Tanacetum coccineum]